jgi:selenocysteine lyase/cysteine desulfurase
VRLVAITGASNVTGERLPVAELTALAHAHGALVLLDTAQLAGVVPLSIAALGVDAMVFAGHKALLGPQGIGGLWAAPHVAFACAAATCAIGEPAAGAPPAAALRAPFPGFCDVGSVNLAGAVGLAAALDWLAAQPPAELARPVAMRARLRAALAGRTRVRALGGDGPHTATLSLAGDALPLATAEAHFAAHGVLVRAGRHCAPMALAALGEPDGCVRISFGPHNRDADVDVVLAAAGG